jgi:phosphate transport system substrate-binding protein
LQYAVEHKVAFGAIMNPAGKSVLASSETLTAACDGAESPRWNNLTASLANAAGADAYPGSSFTWIYVRKDFGDPARLAALSEFLRWMVTEGQQTATQDGYAKLPPQLVPVVEAKIKSLE